MDETDNGSPLGADDQQEGPHKDSENPSKLKTIWHLTAFPRLLILSIYQFSVYLNKLYQDCDAVVVYYEQDRFSFFFVSVGCLVLPVSMYVIFQITSYLTKRESTEPEELGTKTVNGLLLIPWQIKRHLDMLYFVSQRVCSCRKLDKSEDEEILLLERQAMVLEFFEDFFAGLLQILLQAYIFVTSVQYSMKDQPLLGVIVGSVLSILQMMMSIRRKDDGVLTAFLSFSGWLLLTVSRAAALSLVASVIHFWVIFFVLGHAFIVTIWVTSIAIRSHGEQSLHMSAVTNRKGISLFVVVFILFGLPSLMYWPIMFQLRKRKRPLIYLLFTFLENIGLFVFWYFFRSESTWNTLSIAMTAVLFGSCISGILFILLYICVKPKSTDLVVLDKMKECVYSYGIYYDFFEVVFQLPYVDNIGSEVEQAKRILNINT